MACPPHGVASGHPSVLPEFDERTLPATPSGLLVLSAALATLGSLARDADDLDEARAALAESLAVWPSNATAQLKLGELELHHGCFARALRLYESAAAQLPQLAPAAAPAWYAELVVTPRADAVSAAAYTLSLLLHLVGRYDDALPHLRRLGMTYRLAPAVWDAVTARPPPALPPAPPGRRHSDATEDPMRFSGAVPPSLLAFLKGAFAPRAPFWAESDYAARGYFSFWYDVAAPPRNAVEVLARLLLPL
eukprot:1364753-Prymnesium_polylepis.1